MCSKMLRFFPRPLLLEQMNACVFHRSFSCRKIFAPPSEEIERHCEALRDEELIDVRSQQEKLKASLDAAAKSRDEATRCRDEVARAKAERDKIDTDSKRAIEVKRTGGSKAKNGDEEMQAATKEIQAIGVVLCACDYMCACMFVYGGEDGEKSAEEGGKEMQQTTTKIQAIKMALSVSVSFSASSSASAFACASVSVSVFLSFYVCVCGELYFT